MTQYVNKTKEMRQIRFEDGSAAFLKKGQKYSSSKKVKRVDEGIVEYKESKKEKKQKNEQESDETLNLGDINK